MSRKSTILSMLLLVVLFFVVGWFSYEWMIHFVTADMKQSISVTSLQDAFSHRLITSISLACVGAVIGIGVMLGARFSLLISNGRLFFILFLTAIFSMFGWIVMLARRMSELSQQLESTPILPEVTLSITNIPLYEIGIVGSGCTFLIVIILIGKGKKRN